MWHNISLYMKSQASKYQEKNAKYYVSKKQAGDSTNLGLLSWLPRIYT